MMKDVLYSLRRLCNRRTLSAIFALISVFLSKHLFLLYFIYVSFTVYDDLTKSGEENAKYRVLVKVILSLFVLSVGTILLESKNNFFTYWLVASTLACGWLLNIFRKIFEGEGIFSLGCVVVYAAINSFLMVILFRDIRYLVICVTNVSIAISMFLQGKIFSIFERRTNANYTGFERSLLQRFSPYVIPSCIVFILHLFNLIKI
jgi:hypothetical protein